MTFFQTALGIAFRLPAPAIPDHHGAAAIFAFRDGAFEFVVFDGVVLDLDREPLLTWHEAGAARHRPAFHGAADLEPQIVMQPPRGMLLDHESMAALSNLSARLLGEVEAALGVVGRQSGHLTIPHA